MQRSILFFATIILLTLVCIPRTHAQLANTGWPTTFHDMMRTNRTSAVGPQAQPAATKWRKSLPQRFGGGSLRGATIGTNGRSIYLAGGFNGVYSLNKNTGAVEWQRLAETGMGATACPPALSDNEKWVDMGPTISSDGTLFVTAEYGWGMALDPEIGGTENGLKYKFYLCKTEQAVAMDNTSIYAGSWDGKFFAYTIGGSYGGTSTNPKDHSTSRRKWTYKFANPGRHYTYGTPAIGSDGTIYFGYKGIYAFHPDAKCTDPSAHCAAQQKWFAPVAGALETTGGAVPFVGVTVGPEGNIYMLHDRFLHAVSRTGTYLWKITTGSNVRGRSPAVASNGTVYFGSDDGYLYAVNPSGTTDTERIKWKFRLGPCQAFSNSMVDGNETIYINTNCDGGKGRLYAVNPNGTEKWQFNTGTAQGFLHDQQISMDSDGTIFFNSGQNEFAALGGSSTGVTPPQTPTITPTRTPTPTITPTRVPTVTPTPTTSQTSPTPTYLRSDFTGGPGGAKDGRVTIQDLTQLYSEFYKTDLPILKANIATQCPGTTQCQTATMVDIQDYNIFTTDFRAYLETL